MGEHEPRGQIRNGQADAHGPAPRLTVDRHQARQTLGDLVEPWSAAVRAGLPKARDAAVDDAWVYLRQRLVVNIEAVLHVRTEILDHHVGIRDQAQQHRVAVRMLQVQRQAAFVGVNILEIEPVPFARAIILDRIGGFDLDYLRAHLAQLAHAGRPRSGPR